MKTFEYKKLIKNFQEQQDKKSEKLLLEEYYLPSCKYAQKFLSSSIYSNLISYESCEVNSYVYLTFLKAIRNYKYNSKDSLSFKNYLFQMIRFATLYEIKKNFNWQIIPKYQQKCKEYINERKNEVYDLEKEQLKNLENKIRLNKIYKFLKNKKKLYGEIWKLKIKGLDNRDISAKLNIDAQEIKSKFQYIKKIILNKYPSYESIC